jgi:hypothetical protein
LLRIAFCDNERHLIHPTVSNPTHSVVQLWRSQSTQPRVGSRSSRLAGATDPTPGGRSRRPRALVEIDDTFIEVHCPLNGPQALEPTPQLARVGLGLLAHYPSNCGRAVVRFEDHPFAGRRQRSLMRPHMQIRYVACVTRASSPTQVSRPPDEPCALARWPIPNDMTKWNGDSRRTRSTTSTGRPYVLPLTVPPGRCPPAHPGEWPVRVMTAHPRAVHCGRPGPSGCERCVTVRRRTVGCRG